MNLVIALVTIIVMLIVVVVAQHGQVLKAIASEAYARGLYEGEKGRREAAERHVSYGSPIAPAAKELPAAQGKSSEEKAQELGRPFSDETVERGVASLRDQYASVGRILSDADLRAEVIEMLAVDPTMIEG